MSDFFQIFGTLPTLLTLLHSKGVNIGVENNLDPITFITLHILLHSGEGCYFQDIFLLQIFGTLPTLLTLLHSEGVSLGD